MKTKETIQEITNLLSQIQIEREKTVVDREKQYVLLAQTEAKMNELRKQMGFDRPI